MHVPIPRSRSCPSRHEAVCDMPSRFNVGQNLYVSSEKKITQVTKNSIICICNQFNKYRLLIL
jgi:hypothetical protein